MTKIMKFLKIKNYRIFRDFSWSVDLPSFARYNLFYGWNGSGKSTISSLFAYMQRRESLTEGDVTVEVEGAVSVRGTLFSTANIPAVRVFDGNFTRSTLAAIKSASAKPILYLGQKNADDARALESKRGELKTVRESLDAAVSDVNGKVNAVDRYASEQARIIKHHFSASPTYVTFNKTRFLDGIKRIRSIQPKLQPLSEEEKLALDKKRFMQPKADIQSVSPQCIDLKHLVSQVSEALDQTVVSTVLSELASNPPLAKWVQDGLVLHSGIHQSTRCRFCGNVFSENRRREYEAHFNDAYARFQSTLQRLCTDIESRIRQASVTLPAESDFYEDLRSEYATAAVRVTNLLSEAKSALNVLLDALEIKKNKPFEQMRLADVEKEKLRCFSDVDVFDAEITESFEAINGVIDKHNRQTKTIATERDSAYNKLVGDCLLSAASEYDVLKSSEKSALDKKNTLQTQHDLLVSEIEEIELRLTDSREPVEELNKELHAYLGRDDLSFRIQGTGYELLRLGRIANNLSEGECTAITFLYFLKTLEDRDFDKTNGIVVIDDPVSSLDDNALFSAFAYMKDRVKDCGQLFILTHNFQFFRQVKNWMFNLPNQKKNNIDRRPGRFYGLKCSLVDNVRTTAICKLDPLLLEFESEYHFLFKTLYEVANSTEAQELSRYYNVPNMARRILESFMAHYVPDIHGELFKKLECVEYDNAIKTKILRLLHTYSHLDVVAEPGHDPTVLSETREVVKELLMMIKALDENHYNRMVSLISGGHAG